MPRPSTGESSFSSRLDPKDPGEGTSYPAPRVPLFPVVSWGTFRESGTARTPSLLDARATLLVTYGRMAIGLALRDMGIRPGDRVLLPAYHCLSMVDPVPWAGGEPVFYRVRADASVDLEDVRARIDSRTRALMVTHYFGFPQDMEAIRRFCDETGLVLLEDCAHAILGETSGRPLGSFGDYSIASPMKFYPIYEGGLLASDRRPLDQIALRSLGWKFSLRAAFIMLERSVLYRRLGLVGYAVRPFLWAKDAILAVAKSLRPGRSDSWWGPAVGGPSSGRTGDFEPRWVDRRMSRTSRWILTHASRSRIAEARRRHYRALLARLSNLPGARPLFPALPEGVVPFAFPLVVDNPAPVFEELKRHGVPIMRFGEFLDEAVDPRVYPDTIDLSRRVLQFPCHQEMTERDVEWMAARIRDTVLDAARP
jgi:perosamine synthetase